MIGLLALALVCALAGCGAPSSPTPTPPKPTLSPSALATNYRYLNPALYPDRDTPIGQASAQLQAVWTPYDVTVIPGRHLLDSMRSPPQVLNMTNGKLSDADAEALAWAEYRENAFLGWLESNVQPRLNDHLRVHGLFNGVIGNAVRAGQAVTDPACGLYAAQIAVIPVDQTVVAFEAGKGYSVTSQFALVDRYKAPCAVVTAAGPLFTAASDVVIIETGAIQHDDVLGDLFFAQSGRDCESGSAISACGSV
ncbi:hypothetical protein [Candidatus Aeolococcus gillhamiae]|uniref:hypothetical protein n=1 Tax=Candidatus Aeolococcus gillhamiae TaxID=3127015 RepID=UPI003076AE46